MNKAGLVTSGCWEGYLERSGLSNDGVPCERGCVVSTNSCKSHTVVSNVEVNVLLLSPQ